MRGMILLANQSWQDRAQAKSLSEMSISECLRYWHEEKADSSKPWFAH
jgi:hypothetical protein